MTASLEWEPMVTFIEVALRRGTDWIAMRRHWPFPSLPRKGEWVDIGDEDGANVDVVCWEIAGDAPQCVVYLEDQSFTSLEELEGAADYFAEFEWFRDRLSPSLRKPTDAPA
jgi:hypothetical protein